MQGPKTATKAPSSLKAIAFFTLISFIATQTIVPAPTSFAKNSKVPGGDPVLSTTQVLDGKIVVPPELGKIEESFCGNTKKTILFIQDAHDSFEAQENIAKLIVQLVRENAIKTVFEEGYEGPVPTDKFFGFIKDSEIKQKVSYFLLDKLRLGGAEYAHINRTRDFNLIGVDSLKLYSANIKAYQDSSKNRKETEEDLNELFNQVLVLANHYFPKKLKSWLRSKERSVKGKLPLLGYLKELRSLYLEAATDTSRFQQEYPVLSLLLTVETTRDEKLIKRLNALDFKVVFEEINGLEQGLSNVFLPNNRDKQIFDYYQGLILLKRLNQIQLTQSEYEAIKEILQRLKTRKLASFIVTLTHKPLLLSRGWEQHIKDAIQFYDVAQSRDQVIDVGMKDFLNAKKENTAILVFGGFHASAIKEILRQQGFSYAVISPKITSEDKKHQEYYKQLMSVGRYPFEVPFLVARANKPPSIYFTAAMPHAELPIHLELQAIAFAIARLGNQFDSKLLTEQLQKMRATVRSEMRNSREITGAEAYFDKIGKVGVRWQDNTVFPQDIDNGPRGEMVFRRDQKAIHRKRSEHIRLTARSTDAVLHGDYRLWKEIDPSGKISEAGFSRLTAAAMRLSLKGREALVKAAALHDHGSYRPGVHQIIGEAMAREQLALEGATPLLRETVAKLVLAHSDAWNLALKVEDTQLRTPLVTESGAEVKKWIQSLIEEGLLRPVELTSFLKDFESALLILTASDINSGKRGIQVDDNFLRWIHVCIKIALDEVAREIELNISGTELSSDRPQAKSVENSSRVGVAESFLTQNVRVASVQGTKTRDGKPLPNEDRYLVQRIDVDLGGGSRERGLLMAVFDGHMGSTSVDSLRGNFTDRFIASLKGAPYSGRIPWALRSVFNDFQKKLTKETSGATASVVYIPDTKLLVRFLGIDLARWGWGRWVLKMILKLQDLFRRDRRREMGLVFPETRRAYVAVLGDSPILLVDADHIRYQSPVHNFEHNLIERQRTLQRVSAVAAEKPHYDGRYIYDPVTQQRANSTRAFGDAGLDRVLDRRPHIEIVPIPETIETALVVMSDGVISFGSIQEPAHMRRVCNNLLEGVSASEIIEGERNPGKEGVKDDATILIAKIAPRFPMAGASDSVRQRIWKVDPLVWHRDQKEFVEAQAEDEQRETLLWNKQVAAWENGERIESGLMLLREKNVAQMSQQEKESFLERSQETLRRNRTIKDPDLLELMQRAKVREDMQEEELREVTAEFFDILYVSGNPEEVFQYFDKILRSIGQEGLLEKIVNHGRKKKLTFARRGLALRYRLALRAALSKIQMLDREKRSEVSPTLVDVVVSVYKEENRLKSRAEHIHGEDFLRKKVAQLNGLFEGLKKHQWRLTIVDDESEPGMEESRTAVSIKKIIAELEAQGVVTPGQIRLFYLRDALVEEKVESVKASRKGGSILYGLRMAFESGATYAFYTDADTSTNLWQIGRGVLALSDPSVGVVYGSRAESDSAVFNKSLRNELQSKVYSLFVRSNLDIGAVRDSQAGFKGFSKEAMIKILGRGWDKRFSFDTELLQLLKLEGLRLQVLPLAWIDSPDESTVRSSDIFEMQDGVRNQRCRWLDLPRIKNQVDSFYKRRSGSGKDGVRAILEERVRILGEQKYTALEMTEINGYSKSFRMYNSRAVKALSYVALYAVAPVVEALRTFYHFVTYDLLLHPAHQFVKRDSISILLTDIVHLGATPVVKTVLGLHWVHQQIRDLVNLVILPIVHDVLKLLKHCVVWIYNHLWQWVRDLGRFLFYGVSRVLTLLAIVARGIIPVVVDFFSLVKSVVSDLFVRILKSYPFDQFLNALESVRKKIVYALEVFGVFYCEVKSGDRFSIRSMKELIHKAHPEMGVSEQVELTLWSWLLIRYAGGTAVGKELRTRLLNFETVKNLKFRENDPDAVSVYRWIWTENSDQVLLNDLLKKKMGDDAAFVYYDSPDMVLAAIRGLGSDATKIRSELRAEQPWRDFEKNISELIRSQINSPKKIPSLNFLHQKNRELEQQYKKTQRALMKSMLVAAGNNSLCSTLGTIHDSRLLRRAAVAITEDHRFFEFSGYLNGKRAAMKFVIRRLLELDGKLSGDVSAAEPSQNVLEGLHALSTAAERFENQSLEFRAQHIAAHMAPGFKFVQELKGPKDGQKNGKYIVRLVVPVSGSKKDLQYIDGGVILRKLTELKGLVGNSPAIDWAVHFVDGSKNGSTSAVLRKILENSEFSQDFADGRIVLQPINNEIERRRAIKGGQIIWGFRKILASLKSSGQDLSRSYFFFADLNPNIHLGNMGLLMKELVQNNADIAVGSRNIAGAFVDVKPPYGFLLSAFFNFYVRLLMPRLHPLLDTQAGLKAFSAKVTDEILELQKDTTMSFDTEMLLLAHLVRSQGEEPIRIKEIGVTFVDQAGTGYQKTGELVGKIKSGVLTQRKKIGLDPWDPGRPVLSEIGGGTEFTVYSHPLLKNVYKIPKTDANVLLQIGINFLKLFRTQGASNDLAVNQPIVQFLLRDRGIIGRSARFVFEKFKSRGKSLIRYWEDRKREDWEAYERTVTALDGLVPATRLLENKQVRLKTTWGERWVTIPRIIETEKIDRYMGAELMQLIRIGDIDEAEVLIGKYFELQKELWRRGAFDPDPNLLEDVGFTKDGRLVLMDSGDVIWNLAEAQLHVTGARLREKLERYDTKVFQLIAPPRLVKYYERLFKETYTPDNLRALWKTSQQTPVAFSKDLETRDPLNSGQLQSRVFSLWHRVNVLILSSSDERFLPVLRPKDGASEIKPRLLRYAVDYGTTREKRTVEELAITIGKGLENPGSRKEAKRLLSEYLLIREKLPDQFFEIWQDAGIDPLVLKQNGIELEKGFAPIQKGSVLRSFVSDRLRSWVVHVNPFRYEGERWERSQDYFSYLKNYFTAAAQSYAPEGGIEVEALQPSSAGRGFGDFFPLLNFFDDVKRESLVSNSTGVGLFVIAGGKGMRQGLLTLNSDNNKSAIPIFGKPLAVMAGEQALLTFHALPKTKAYTVVTTTDSVLLPDPATLASIDAKIADSKDGDLYTFFDERMLPRKPGSLASQWLRIGLRSFYDQIEHLPIFGKALSSLARLGYLNHYRSTKLGSLGGTDTPYAFAMSLKLQKLLREHSSRYVAIGSRMNQKGIFLKFTRHFLSPMYYENLQEWMSIREPEVELVDWESLWKIAHEIKAKIKMVQLDYNREFLDINDPRAVHNLYQMAVSHQDVAKRSWFRDLFELNPRANVQESAVRGAVKVSQNALIYRSSVMADEGVEVEIQDGVVIEHSRLRFTGEKGAHYIVAPNTVISHSDITGPVKRSEYGGLLYKVVSSDGIELREEEVQSSVMFQGAAQAVVTSYKIDLGPRDWDRKNRLMHGEKPLPNLEGLSLLDLFEIKRASMIQLPYRFGPQVEGDVRFFRSKTRQGKDLQEIVDLMAKRDALPEQADVLVIFGSPNSSAVARDAARIYAEYKQKGRAIPWVIASGRFGLHITPLADNPDLGKDKDGREVRAEALNIRDVLIQNGVPESSILTEKQSRGMTDNGLFTANILADSKNKTGFVPLSIIFMHDPLLQLRGSLSLRNALTQKGFDAKVYDQAASTPTDPVQMKDSVLWQAGKLTPEIATIIGAEKLSRIHALSETVRFEMRLGMTAADWQETYDLLKEATFGDLSKNVDGFALSGDGRWILVMENFGKVKLMDLRTKQEKTAADGRLMSQVIGGPVFDAVFLKDSPLLRVKYDDETEKLFNVVTGEETSSKNVNITLPPFHAQKEKNVSPDGKWLFSKQSIGRTEKYPWGTSMGVITDAATGEEMRNRNGVKISQLMGEGVGYGKFSPDGRWFSFNVDGYNSLRVFDLSNVTELRGADGQALSKVLSQLDSFPFDYSFSHEGHFLWLKMHTSRSGLGKVLLRLDLEKFNRSVGVARIVSGIKDHRVNAGLVFTALSLLSSSGVIKDKAELKNMTDVLVELDDLNEYLEIFFELWDVFSEQDHGRDIFVRLLTNTMIEIAKAPDDASRKAVKNRLVTQTEQLAQKWRIIKNSWGERNIINHGKRMRHGKASEPALTRKPQDSVLKSQSLVDSGRRPVLNRRQDFMNRIRQMKESRDAGELLIVDLSEPLSLAKMDEVRRVILSGGLIALDLKMLPDIYKYGNVEEELYVLDRVVRKMDAFANTLSDILGGSKMFAYRELWGNDFVGLGYILRELLKNSFLHGNKLDYSIPLVFRMRPFAELELFDSGSLAPIPFAAAETEKAGIGGRHSFLSWDVEMLIGWQYDRHMDEPSGMQVTTLRRSETREKTIDFRAGYEQLVRSDLRDAAHVPSADISRNTDRVKLHSEARTTSLVQEEKKIFNPRWVVRSVKRSVQPATVFMDAEDFSSLSPDQKQEYLFVALSNKAVRMIVYNERGQVQDDVLKTLLKLDRVQRTDRNLDQTVKIFFKPNVPAVHLSKEMLPSYAQVRGLRNKVAFFKAIGNKSGTLATALLWAISGGTAARMIGVNEKNGFWTVDETLLDALQRTYDNNFVIAVAA